jgi:inositol oxygenase
MSYTSLLNEKDKQYLEWIKDFNKYDLYTKSNKTYDLDEIIDYYDPIAKKYLGDTLIYW